MATRLTRGGLALGLCAALVASGCVRTEPVAESRAETPIEDGGKGKPQPAETTGPVATTVTVSDMDCEVCAGKLVKKLTAVAGVAKVEADVKAQTLTITPKEKEAPSPKALWEVCVAAGYSPSKLEGPSGVFTSVPTP